MHFPFGDSELENKLLALENALLRSGGSHRGISPQEQTVRDFGERLFKAILTGDVKTRYEVSLREARRQNKGLRLKLRIQPPKLALLPWEFLYDPDGGDYLCFSASTPLVRYVDLRRPVEQLPITPPLRILGMVASPTDLPQLDVDKEKRLVEESIKFLRAKGLVELTWLEEQTWSALQEAMWGGLGTSSTSSATGTSTGTMVRAALPSRTRQDAKSFCRPGIWPGCWMTTAICAWHF